MLDSVKPTAKLVSPLHGGAMSNTADKLAAAYIAMREAIKQKEDEIKDIKEQQEQVTAKILELCEEQNIDSLKTPDGTITRRVHTHYWTSDWDKMYEFIKAEDVMHLLEKRVHNGNMKDFLECNPDVAPPGLQVNRKHLISVRKPSKK